MPGLGGRKDPRGARERPQRPLSVVNQGLLPNCVVEQNGPLRPPKVLPGAAPSPRGARKPWDGASVDGAGRADLRKVVVYAEVSIVHFTSRAIVCGAATRSPAQYSTSHSHVHASAAALPRRGNTFSRRRRSAARRILPGATRSSCGPHTCTQVYQPPTSSHTTTDVQD